MLRFAQRARRELAVITLPDVLPAIFLQPLLNSSWAELADVLRLRAAIALVRCARVHLHLLDGASSASKGDARANGSSLQYSFFLEVDLRELPLASSSAPEHLRHGCRPLLSSTKACEAMDCATSALSPRLLIGSAIFCAWLNFPAAVARYYLLIQLFPP